MSEPSLRLRLLSAVFFLVAVAAFVSIQLAYDEPAPDLTFESSPFGPEPGDGPEAPPPVVEASPFGAITVRDRARPQAPGPPLAARPKIIDVVPSDPEVQSGWYTGADGYAVARLEQARLRRPMLLYFKVDWCPACRAFDRDVLSAGRVAPCLRSAVKVSVNPDHGSPDRQLADRLGVTGYPTLLAISAPDAKPRRLDTGVRRGANGMEGDAGAFAVACAAELGI